MLPALQPWEKIDWSPEQQQIMYRDWGLYYTHKQQLDVADHYYNKSLELNPDDEKALFFRSKCKRSIAKTQDALEDALAAAELDDNNERIKLEICNALYELNRFEDCKVESHNNTRRFAGKKAAGFQNRLVVLEENFNDSIGETLGPFIQKNEKHFNAVRKQIEDEKYIETRPLWKIMKEQEKCDVLSILEKEEIILSPREVARRELSSRVFNQIYLNKTWMDVLFLKKLRDDPSLLLAQSKYSTPFLQHLTSSKYDVIKKFLKMLQSRSPLYNERARRWPNKKVWAHQHEEHLTRVQYQTRRNMNTILRGVQKLRNAGQIEKLSNYIEEVMGDYVVLKTYRVMPWKVEFLHEIYNTLALAHADRFVIPEDYKNAPLNDRLSILLRMRHYKTLEPTTYVFGDRKTYQEPDAVDHTQITYKNFLNRLEKRMRFTKYSIEKCYLLHEIARSHLKQNRFDECCAVARKAVEETKNSKIHLWQFLSVILICKSYAVLHKIERAKEALEEASAIAVHLKCPRIAEFVEECRSINEEELNSKKRVNSSESIRKRSRSRASVMRASSSQISMASEGSGNDQKA